MCQAVKRSASSQLARGGRSPQRSAKAVNGAVFPVYRLALQVFVAGPNTH